MPEPFERSPDRKRGRWEQFLRGGLATTLLSRTHAERLLPRDRYLVRGPAESRSVALTYDDGPHPVHTPRLLDALKRERLVATFFVIGRNAERHPDLVRRATAEGHLVANHTYSHPDPARMSSALFLDEVLRTRDLLAKLSGSEPIDLLRPPFGRLTFAKLVGAWRRRQSLIFWNRDAKDYDCGSTEEIRRRFSAHPLKAGDVLLMHDNHPHAAELLPEFAGSLRDRGLGTTTVRPWVQH